jgi:demethoxyubiquinone hydroxylase (CLK1/Coq7/Cat5 family)
MTPACMQRLCVMHTFVLGATTGVLTMKVGVAVAAPIGRSIEQ